MKHKHQPFKDGKFKGLWDSIKNSPYPWHYTLRWPWYFHYPSLRNHSGLIPMSDNYGQPNDSPQVKLLFGGDIMVLNGDKPPILSEPLCHLISSADLFIANLEAPLGQHQPDSDKLYSFRFHMPKAFLDAIQRQSQLPYTRWVLTNANNHSGDAGISGFDDSISLLDASGVLHVGHKESAGLWRTVNINGMTLAIAGWTHWLNRDVFHHNQPVVTQNDVIAHAFSDDKIKQQIDFTIGLPHWEFEFQHFPKEKTRRYARQYIENGFDMLLGSHPHVLQPYEVINGKHCFYSLGNFCGLGIAQPVKIITLLEVHLTKFATTTEMTYFRHHHFYQWHDSEGIKIIPISQVPEQQASYAVERLAKVIKPYGINRDID